MGGLEGGFHLREGEAIESRISGAQRRASGRHGECRHHQRGVGAGVADVRTDEDLDRLRGDALVDDFAPGVLRQSPADARDRCQRRIPERLFDRLLARGADVGEAHAVGG